MIEEKVISYEVVVSTDKACFVIERDNYESACDTWLHWLKQPECKGREVFIQKVERTKVNSLIGG